METEQKDSLWTDITGNFGFFQKIVTGLFIEIERANLLLRRLFDWRFIRFHSSHSKKGSFYFMCGTLFIIQITDVTLWVLSKKRHQYELNGKLQR